MRSAGRRSYRTAAYAVIPLGSAVLPESARAAAGHAAAQSAVGTLPLLAALGIGIAIAAGAVIAFLQMTAKDREKREALDWSDTDANEFDDRFTDFDGMDGSDARPAEVAAGSDYGSAELADLTIPLARVQEETATAEPDEESGPRLCGVGGEFAGTCFRLNGFGLSIGRDPAQCQVVFPHEFGEVSRRHCTLRFQEERGVFLLEDHGSSNGTYFQGGERLQPGKSYELRSGDRFALSGTVHWFEVRQ